MRKYLPLIPAVLLTAFINVPIVSAAENCTCPVALVCTETADPVTPSETPTTYPDANFALNAVMPAPTDGAAEWIEITNLGESASLFGWTIDDSEGGSNPHLIENDQLMPSGGTIVLTDDMTKLALNNTGDEVRLFSPNGMLVDSLSYEKAKSGVALIKNDSVWTWADELNAEVPASENTDANDSTGTTDDSITEESGGSDVSANPIGSIVLSDDQVLVSGVVTLPPGAFSQTIFSLRADDGSGYLARIYGDGAPELAVGDYIAFPAKLNDTEDDGVMASVTGSKIVWISSGNNQTVTALDLSEIDESHHGQIVSLSGTVSNSGSSWLNLTDESLSTEVKIDVSPESVPALEPGTDISLTGVVRWQNDAPLIKTTVSQLSLNASSTNNPANSEANDNGDERPVDPSLGEITETKTIEIQPKNGENGMLSSIAISLSGLGATVMAVWRKKNL